MVCDTPANSQTNRVGKVRQSFEKNRVSYGYVVDRLRAGRAVSDQLRGGEPVVTNEVIIAAIISA